MPKIGPFMALPRRTKIEHMFTRKHTNKTTNKQKKNKKNTLCVMHLKKHI
jgi:hypothetical protein